MAGKRQQPDHEYTQFIPKMALLDREMQKIVLNMAACIARNTENNEPTIAKSIVTAIFRVIIGRE